MPPSTSSSLDPKVVFAPCYREGPSRVPKCIGYVKDKARRCNNRIGQEKMEEHVAQMVRLNRLPLQERAESPILVEATSLLLCHHHIESNLSRELERAKKKFQDAVIEEGKRKEEEETKQQIEVQREADKKEEGVAPPRPPPPPPPTTRAPRTPQTPYAPQILLASPAPCDLPTPPATIQSTDEFPSESDSESDSDSEDEDKRTGTVDPWTAYQARWKEVIDNGVREGMPLEYQIPWPVVSGHLANVDHVQVGHFFNQAVKDKENLGIGKVLYYELDHWERCGLKKRFGRTVYKMYKPQFKMILAIVSKGAADFWRKQE